MINQKKVSPEKEEENNRLILIPKAETYIEYMIMVIMKMPRTEKFNIGNEHKNSMYTMLREIMYLSKIPMKDRLEVIWKIDAELNTQRIFLRIMKKANWIEKKKFDVGMSLIYELGKIIGGLEKYYAKNYPKPV